MRISILFDNQSIPPFKSMWGFSCFISPYKFLFDTGSSYEILHHNAKLLGIELRNVSGILLSHFHWDHTGGALDLLSQCEPTNVYVLSSFSHHFIQEIVKLGHSVTVVEDSLQLSEGIISTGPIEGVVSEQGLLVKSKKGWILITGCAHPGIIRMIRRSSEIVKERLSGVIGGFHLLNLTPIQIKDIAEELNRLIKDFVGACHCTGETAKEIISQIIKGKFLEVAAGVEVTL